MTSTAAPEIIRTATAWELIGFGGTDDGQTADVRIRGGRTLYEAVDYDDCRGGRLVRLARLQVTAGGIRQITRYIEPDTVLEVVR